MSTSFKSRKPRVHSTDKNYIEGGIYYHEKSTDRFGKNHYHSEICAHCGKTFGNHMLSNDACRM